MNNDIDEKMRLLHKSKSKSILESTNWINNSKDGVRSIQNISQILPGKFYKFNYNPVTKKELDFYDKTPFIFAIDIIKDSNIRIVGFNLNYVDLETKIEFVSSLYSIYNTFINNMIKKYPNDAILQHRLNFAYSEIKGNLPDNKIRTYFVNKMNNVKTISYENFYKIPYILDYNIVGTQYTKIIKT